MGENPLNGNTGLFFKEEDIVCSLMIDYACEISKHEEDKALADEIAKYAQYRLEHFMNFHKLFETEASKEKNVDKETVSECMWHETHEMFQHWYDDIERKIKKYS